MKRAFRYANLGLPSPYLLTPKTREEALTGKATLIAHGDIDLLLSGVIVVAPEREDLIQKLTELRDS